MEKIKTYWGEATIGFDNFAEAEAYAEAHGETLRHLERRQGEDRWHVGDRAREPYYRLEDYEGRDYLATFDNLVADEAKAYVDGLRELVEDDDALDHEALNELQVRLAIAFDECPEGCYVILDTISGEIEYHPLFTMFVDNGWDTTLYAVGSVPDWD